MAKWMALLGYRDSSIFWQCGGSVITERHVLTAAHCVKRNLYLVRLGALDLARSYGNANPIDFLVKKAIRHENYTKFHNDIAILVLDQVIDFKSNAHLTPICLPIRDTSYRVGKPESAYVTGWGETEKRGSSSHLLYAYVNILPRSHCARAYSSRNVVIDERVLCAGDAAGERDACNGDSGGPLIARQVVPHPPGHFGGLFHFQQGIVSYGFKCSAKRFSGIYTNISHFMPWIEEKVLGKTALLKGLKLDHL